MYIYEIVAISVVFFGFAYAAWRLYSDNEDPPQRLRAVVAGKRIQPKKTDKKETYKYIVTFFIPGKKKYLRCEVSQVAFDEIMEKDTGLLTCRPKGRKFIGWELTRELTAP